MSTEAIEAELARIKSLHPGAQQHKALSELYRKILERFASGTADLTLDDVFSYSRTALGMQGPADPRHT